MTFGRYASLVATVLVGGLLVARLALADETFPAVAFGVGLAALNTLAAHFFATWSAGKSMGTFMTAVLGGMGLRMAVMLAAVLFALEVLGMPRLPLVISLLVPFAAFLVLELWLTAGRRPSTAEAR